MPATEDALAGLRTVQENLQRSLAEFREVLADAADALHQDGADTDVVVELAADGLPQSVRLSRTWEQRVSAESLGAEVTAAAQLAGVRRGLDAMPPPETVSVPVSVPSARPTEDVLEQLLSATRRSLDGVQGGEPAATVEGADRSGQVRVSVGASGQASFSVVPAPRGATAAQLMTQFSEALDHLRHELAAERGTQRSTASSPGSSLEQLVLEAIAHINPNPASPSPVANGALPR